MEVLVNFSCENEAIRTREICETKNYVVREENKRHL